MSSDETPNVPTPPHSRAAVREKAQQVSAQQSRARILRRVIIGAIAIVVVGAAGGAVAWAVGSAVSKPSMTPSNLHDDGVLVTKSDLDAARSGSASTASPTPSTAGTAAPVSPASPAPSPTPTAGTVDIHVYVDYLSPGAGDFERANAKQLATWVEQDAATVTYHPVALLTANSNGTKYSLRAASAAACVASAQPDAFYAYNHALLTDQPKLDSDGKSDAELAALAGSSGVKDVKRREGLHRPGLVHLLGQGRHDALAGRAAARFEEARADRRSDDRGQRPGVRGVADRRRRVQPVRALGRQ